MGLLSYEDAAGSVLSVLASDKSKVGFFSAFFLFFFQVSGGLAFFFFIVRQENGVLS